MICSSAWEGTPPLHQRSTMQTHRVLLKALGFPHWDSFDAANDQQFRFAAAWLENMKVGGQGTRVRSVGLASRPHSG